MKGRKILGVILVAVPFVSVVLWIVVRIMVARSTATPSDTLVATLRIVNLLLSIGALGFFWALPPGIYLLVKKDVVQPDKK